MRCLAILAAIVLSSAPAQAFQAADALPCFNFLPMDIGIGAEAEINVILDDHGLPTSIDVRWYQPDSEDGRRLAMAAAQAVQNCGPYTDSPSFWGTIWLGPETARNPEPQPVITMPDNADGTSDALANDILKIIEGK